MLIQSNAGVMFVGFIVSLWLLPRANRPDYFNKFFGYAAAIMLLLTATSEAIVQHPIPFYFMLGSGITLLYTVLLMVRKIPKNKENP